MPAERNTGEEIGVARLAPGVHKARSHTEDELRDRDRRKCPRPSCVAAWTDEKGAERGWATSVPTSASAIQSNRGKRWALRSGGRRMVAGDAGSLASATAGSPSVSTLTGSTWTTVIGVPSPAGIATAKRYLTRFAESRKATNLRMLSVIARPSGLRR